MTTTSRAGTFPYPGMILGLVLALGANGPVLAQQPKEGDIDWLLCFGGSVHALAPVAQEQYAVYIVSGATRPQAGLMQAMSLECVGSYEVRSRVGRHKGYCVYQDASGDKIFGTDSATPQGYTWEFYGGTGRFEGMTGSGTVDRLSPLSPVRPGTMQACRRMQGRFKLP